MVILARVGFSALLLFALFTAYQAVKQIIQPSTVPDSPSKQELGTAQHDTSEFSRVNILDNHE